MIYNHFVIVKILFSAFQFTPIAQLWLKYKFSLANSSTIVFFILILDKKPMTQFDLQEIKFGCN